MPYTSITVVVEYTAPAKFLIVYFAFSQLLQQLRWGQAYVNSNSYICNQTDVSKCQRKRKFDFYSYLYLTVYILNVSVLNFKHVESTFKLQPEDKNSKGRECI